MAEGRVNSLRASEWMIQTRVERDGISARIFTRWRFGIVLYRGMRPRGRSDVQGASVVTNPPGEGARPQCGSGWNTSPKRQRVNFPRSRPAPRRAVPCGWSIHSLALRARTFEFSIHGSARKFRCARRVDGTRHLLQIADWGRIIETWKQTY